MKRIIGAAFLGSVMLLAPASYADNARDELIRTEAKIATLNAVDASAAAPTNFREAELRLNEARAADKRNKDEDVLWRAKESSLQADIVQEKIKLFALQRTVTEIETGLATLRRELNS